MVIRRSWSQKGLQRGRAMILNIHNTEVRLTRQQTDAFARRIHQVLARFGPHIESASLNFQRLSTRDIRCNLSFSGPRCGVHIVNSERPDADSALNAAAESVGAAAGRSLTEKTPAKGWRRNFHRRVLEIPNRRARLGGASSNHEQRKAD